MLSWPDEESCQVQKLMVGWLVNGAVATKGIACANSASVRSVVTCDRSNTACLVRVQRSSGLGGSGLAWAVFGWLYTWIPLATTATPHPRIGHTGQK